MQSMKDVDYEFHHLCYAFVFSMQSSIGYYVEACNLASEKKSTMTSNSPTLCLRARRWLSISRGCVSRSVCVCLGSAAANIRLRTLTRRERSRVADVAHGTPQVVVVLHVVPDDAVARPTAPLPGHLKVVRPRRSP